MYPDGRIKKLDLQAEHFLLENIDDLDEFLEGTVKPNPKIHYLVFCPSLDRHYTDDIVPKGYNNVTLWDANELERHYGEQADDIHGYPDIRPRLFYQLFDDKESKRFLEETVAADQAHRYEVWVPDSDLFSELYERWETLRRINEHGMVRTLNNCEMHYDSIDSETYEAVLKLPVAWTTGERQFCTGFDRHPNVARWSVPNAEVGENVLSAYIHGGDELPDYDLVVVAKTAADLKELQKSLKKRAADAKKYGDKDLAAHITVEPEGDSLAEFYGAVFGFNKGKRP